MHIPAFHDAHFFFFGFALAVKFIIKTAASVVSPDVDLANANPFNDSNSIPLVTSMISCVVFAATTAVVMELLH